MRILHSSQNFWRWERVWIFDVLPKKTCERKALQVQVYIQQWSLDEQGVKFMWSLTFFVCSEMTLDMHYLLVSVFIFTSTLEVKL